MLGLVTVESVVVSFGLIIVIGAVGAVGVPPVVEGGIAERLAYPSILGRGVISEIPRPSAPPPSSSVPPGRRYVTGPLMWPGIDVITTVPAPDRAPAARLSSTVNLVSIVRARASRLSRWAPRPSSATLRSEPLRRRVFCCWRTACEADSGGTLFGMDQKEGVGGDVGEGAGTSFSSVLRRDRGRRCSAEERIKGILANKLAAPDVLRLRVSADGRLVPTASASAAACDDGSSMAR
jgi:hypothetical protein